MNRRVISKTGQSSDQVSKTRRTFANRVQDVQTTASKHGHTIETINNFTTRVLGSFEVGFHSFFHLKGSNDVETYEFKTHVFHSEASNNQMGKPRVGAPLVRTGFRVV